MPLSHTYLEDGGVLRTGNGLLTFADVTAVNRVLYASPEKIRAIAYQISDYSAVERIEISAREVLILSKADQEAARINPNMLVAVVGQKDVMFGLLRMWENYAGGSKLHASVFRDLEQAKNWIQHERSGENT